jgi:5-methylcytosine-specific restriction endonuclease McrA
LGNPIEAAHFRLVVSEKTGDVLPRSHKTEAAWGAVPLCKACHLRQHTMSEADFREETLYFAEKWGSLLLRFFTEEETPF